MKDMNVLYGKDVLRDRNSVYPALTQPAVGISVPIPARFCFLHFADIP